MANNNSTKGGLGEYLRQTRMELRHVAWPTRTQTIIYTVLVAAISIGVALYLGFFDFLFTTGLAHLLDVLPQASAVPTVQTTSNPITVTQTPAPSTNSTGSSQVALPALSPTTK